MRDEDETHRVKVEPQIGDDHDGRQALAFTQMEVFRNLVFLVDRQIRSVGQGVENLLLLSWPWRQDAKPTVVEELKAGERQEIQVLVEDDLVHQRSLFDGGHAVVGGDDDVQAVSQAVAIYGVSQVTDGAVDLPDDHLSVSMVWTLGVAHAVRLAKVQRHQVEILLREPVHHRVDVLTPLCLVVIRKSDLLYQGSVDCLAAVVGCASWEV